MDISRIHYFCRLPTHRMKGYRYIADLLLICFSAFLGHNLVPHHHHSVVFHSPVATDYPFEHGDQHGHDHDTDADGHPVHCHAFNDVVFEKYSAPLNKPWTGQVRAMMVSGQILIPEAPLVVTSSPFTLLSLPCRSHTDIGSRALRAPPAFA